MMSACAAIRPPCRTALASWPRSGTSTPRLLNLRSRREITATGYGDAIPSFWPTEPTALKRCTYPPSLRRVGANPTRYCYQTPQGPSPRAPTVEAIVTILPRLPPCFRTELYCPRPYFHARPVWPACPIMAWRKGPIRGPEETGTLRRGMFSSFFPTPRLFFPAALFWTALAMALWYGLARDLGPELSLGGLAGFPYPPAGAAPAAAGGVAYLTAQDIWLYQYMIVFGVVFCVGVAWALPHRWARWSVWGSFLIVFLLWFQVQLDVMINGWFGTFYNMVQQALGKPGTVTLEAFFGQLWTFGWIAMVYIFTAVLTAFFTSHYVFRWRTAMNEFYVEHWQRLPHRGRLAARPGRHPALRRHRRGAGHQPGPGGDDPDRLPADPVGPVVLREGAAGGRPAAAGAGVRRRRMGRARHRRSGGGGRAAARAYLPQPAGRGGLPQGAGAGRGRCAARRPADPARAVLRRAAELFPAVRELPLFQRRALRLPAGRRAGALHRAGADHCRRRADPRRADPDHPRLRPGRGIVPVPGAVVDDHRVAAVDLQAPARLRGDAGRRAAVGDRARADPPGVLARRPRCARDDTLRP